MDATRLSASPALLRAAPGDHSVRGATANQPRLVRRRTAVVVVTVLTPLALLVGASAAELRTPVTPAQSRHAAPTPGVAPTRDLGTCASDLGNLFVTLALMPGDVASDVVTRLSPDYAAAIHSIASTTARDVLPPPPDAPTLAHVLARLSGTNRKAVVSALSPEQQAAINSALLDTALTFMTYGVRPACP